MKTLVAAALLLSLIPAVEARVDPKKALAGLDALIEKSLVDQKIPGVSVGIVFGDEVVLLKGYGLRDIDGKKPMTPDTLIPIASVTKQFTVASLGVLVRQGKLDWDQPVRDYMPDFRLHDDVATLRATPRDLVTHRIGLPRHDWAWYGSTATREDLYQSLQHFPLNKDIRTRFQYNNLMFMTAGYLAGRMAGKSYEDHVRASLFEPMGMTRTNFSLSETASDSDAALGYQLDQDRKLVRDPFESVEPMAPTGGINSTARDLVRWIRMLLGGGTIDGKRILLQSDVEAMMQPNTPITRGYFPESGFRSYGMGLFVESYRGHEVASHAGNLNGAAAMVMMIPKEKIGVVVLTNRTGGVLRDGLPLEIADRLLGLPSARMIERIAEMEKKSFAGQDAAKAAGASDQRKGTQPSHPLAEYAGRYSEAGYGPVDVTMKDGVLHLTYHNFSARLDHWHYDVFQTPADPTSRLDRFRVQFQTDLEGEISGVAVPMETNVAPTVFVKQPPAEMTERKFLEQFTGTYEINGTDRQVALREDGVLQYIVFGRVYDLLPVRGTLFRLKGLAGVSMEFLADSSGKIDRAAIHSGGSTIGPKKK